MSNPDFAGEDFEFAAGSLHGLRGWGMDKSGRLHGVTHKEVWRPGENTSVCKAQFSTSRCPGPSRRTVNVPKVEMRSWLSLKAYPGPELPRYDVETVYESCRHPRCDGYQHMDPKSEDTHHFDPKCQCGFWAYDEAGFIPQGKVIGVIEAYGKTTIGTKGFRAEKARIVGLCRKDNEGKAHSLSVLTRLASLYPEATLYQDIDAMVEAHAAVLRSWPEVGEGFWDEKVKDPQDDAWRHQLLGMHWPATSFYPSSLGRWSA